MEEIKKKLRIQYRPSQRISQLGSCWRVLPTAIARAAVVSYIRRFFRRGASLRASRRRRCRRRLFLLLLAGDLIEVLRFTVLSVGHANRGLLIISGSPTDRRRWLAAPARALRRGWVSAASTTRWRAACAAATAASSAGSRCWRRPSGTPSSSASAPSSRSSHPSWYYLFTLSCSPRHQRLHLMRDFTLQRFDSSWFLL